MELDEFLKEWNNECTTVEVQTSGSTGVPKKMRVEKARMVASAVKTCDFLGLRPGNSALLCMPLQYIAGKMMVVRSIVRGLKLVSVHPSSEPLLLTDEHIDFAAMVPMQVIKTLESDEGRRKFKQIRNVIIGGGAIDPALEAQLKDFPNAVWSTYGMTETLSHIAMRRLSGETAGKWYTPLSNVHVELSDNETLVISAPDICDGVLVTNDRAVINEKGQFRILGRTDNTINSGGVKLQIEEIESRISELIGNADAEGHFRIAGKKDPLFGEIVVMLLDESILPLESKIAEAVAELPKYWRPREVIKVKSLPMTGNGKPDRATTALMVNEKPAN